MVVVVVVATEAAAVVVVVVAVRGRPALCKNDGTVAIIEFSAVSKPLHLLCIESEFKYDKNQSGGGCSCTMTNPYTPCNPCLR